MPAPSSSTLTTDVNVATTSMGADTGNEQTGPDPHEGPLQPVNVDAESAVAVRVTVDPAANAAVQVVPQSRRTGVDVMVPSPVPWRSTRTG